MLGDVQIQYAVISKLYLFFFQHFFGFSARLLCRGSMAGLGPGVGGLKSVKIVR